MKQEQAMKVLLSGANCLVSGPAGSGKSYTIKEFVKEAKKRGKRVAITATTGIAAAHIGGSTIHSWSGIGIGNKLPPGFIYTISEVRRKAIKKVDVLIIDEISMMNDYVFDMVNEAMKLIREDDRPFGGLQIILVGDFFQLPPVDKSGEGKFVTDSKSWGELDMKVCYLEEQHRAEDLRLQEILNAMREGSLRQRHLNYLKERWMPPPTDDITKIYTLNIDVEHENNKRLRELPGDSHYFLRTSRGNSFDQIEHLQKNILAPEVLVLKTGALVMAVKNDPSGRFANGSTGRVERFTQAGLPVVRFDNGSSITVGPQEWELRKNDRVSAAITQIPLRLAYAITVHKSQGMTLDAAEVDLSKAFVPGMGYVGLSRVKNLNTLYIKGLNQRSLMMSKKAHQINDELLKRSRELE